MWFDRKPEQPPEPTEEKRSWLDRLMRREAPPKPEADAPAPPETETPAPPSEAPPAAEAPAPAAEAPEVTDEGPQVIQERTPVIEPPAPVTEAPALAPDAPTPVSAAPEPDVRPDMAVAEPPATPTEAQADVQEALEAAEQLPPPPPEDQAPLEPEPAPEEKRGFWQKTWEVLNKPVFTLDRESLSKGIEKTRSGFVQRLRKIANRWTKIDEDAFEELEEILLESDVGVAVSESALDHLRQLHKKGDLNPENLTDKLEEYLRDQLGPTRTIELEPGVLNIVMLVGVNGVGKTTTLGKLAYRFHSEGHRPVIAAADTFRAAAIDQLAVWAERVGADLIRHQEGGDAAAVVFDGIKAAQARKADVLLIDTAGRLHNKAHLMAELEKIRRVVDREAPDAPKEALLVLDATTGQNGLRQAAVFAEATKLTGVILTKLDGTAKGGVIFGINEELKLPVKLIGLGERIEDLKDFDPQLFVDTLFSREEETP